MGRGKGSWWRLFIDAENDVISAFTSLCLDDLREDNIRAQEKFACQSLLRCKIKRS